MTTHTRTRHIDLYRTDDAYRVLSDTVNHWGNRIDAIHDGANEGVSLHAASKFLAESEAKRRAYLELHGITFDAPVKRASKSDRAFGSYPKR